MATSGISNKLRKTFVKSIVKCTVNVIKHTEYMKESEYMKPVIKLIFKVMTQQHPVTHRNIYLPFSAARKSWPLHQTNNMVCTLYTQEAQP